MNILEESFIDETIDPDIFLSKIGLDTVVSSQRTNGFGQAINKIHNKLKN